MWMNKNKMFMSKFLEGIGKENKRALKMDYFQNEVRPDSLSIFFIDQKI